jgi:cell division protease FtsH
VRDLPEGAALRRSEYSERTAEAIDEEVRGLLLASAERVRQTLTAHRTELLALAHELLQHEVVDRKTLTNILQAGAVEAPLASDFQSHVA